MECSPMGALGALPRRATTAEETPNLLQQTLTFERVKYGKVQHGSQRTPASGDTNSREWLQVAGVEAVTVAPLDQESPGSSPGGAMKPGNDLPVAGLLLSAGCVSQRASRCVSVDMLTSGLRPSAEPWAGVAQTRPPCAASRLRVAGNTVAVCTSVPKSAAVDRRGTCAFITCGSP
jgi:hypothetical protein